MGNEKHETIADIVAEMRKRAEEVYAGQAGYPESWKDQMDYGEIYELADRIESANRREHEATVEKSSAVGNAAAKRDALVMVKRLFNGRLMWQSDIRKAHEAVNAALAAPPRNCDVGSAEEQYKRHQVWCERKRCESILCRLCFARWSHMPYDGEAVE